ncbi:MAG: dTDP-glucose 4,6-dehydratase, partial [Candidatus Omnitrophota bacterium]
LKNIDIAKGITDIAELGRDIITYVKDRPGHDRRYALNSNRLNNLGWKPGFDFEKAIKLTFDWYQANSWWWKPIKRKAKIIEW